MRYFDFTVTPNDGTLHPVETRMAESATVKRIAILHIDLLGDGTGVLLYKLEGTPTDLMGAIEDHSEVLAYDLLEATDEDFHLYLHVTPGDPVATMMKLAQEYALMIDTPIEFTDRGAVKITLVGDHNMVRQAMDQLPDDVAVSVDEVGAYSPDRRDMLSMLTDRQLEVFQKAVELGYYEIPRRTTHEEIAEHLECAPSTVDEHLRKAESRVLRGLVG